MTDQDVIDIAGLIWRRWADAHANLTSVRLESDDGSPDWGAFHVEHLERAGKEEARWGDLNQRWIDENRSVIATLLP